MSRARCVALVAAALAVTGCPPSTNEDMARKRFSDEQGCPLKGVTATLHAELSAHDMLFGESTPPSANRAGFDALNTVYLVSGCNKQKYHLCRRGDRNRLQCPPLPPR